MNRIMKHRRQLALLLVSILVISALAGCGGKDNNSVATDPPSKTTESSTNNTEDNVENTDTDVDPIKIAAFFNMSGSGADSGLYSQMGYQMAIDDINAAGGIKSLGGAQLEVIIGDTMTDTSQAKAVADRVLADEEIIAAIGFSGSAWCVPMLPSFEKAGVPIVLNSTANAITSQGYQMVFQHAPTSENFGKQQVAFIKWVSETYGVEITKVGALYENTENGLSNAKGARENAEAAGFEWVYEEAFPFNLSDASNLVVGMKNSGAQVIFLTALSQDAKLISNTMKSMNYTPITMGSGAGFLMPAFAEELGEDVDGIISICSTNWDTPAVENNPDLADVAVRFEEKHGLFMPEHAVCAYNGIYLIAQALEKTGSRDKADLAAALRDIGVDGFTGNATFSPEGANQGVTVPVIQWQKDPDGKYRPRNVFPDFLATTEYQLPSLLKEQQGE